MSSFRMPTSSTSVSHSMACSIHLSSQHIGSALVTKSDRLVGIFTLTDAARLFSRHLRSLFPCHSGDEVA